MNPRDYMGKMQLLLGTYYHDLLKYRDNLTAFSTPRVTGIDFYSGGCNATVTGQTCHPKCWRGFSDPATRKLNSTDDIEIGSNQTNNTSEIKHTLTCGADGSLVGSLPVCVGNPCEPLGSEVPEMSLWVTHRRRSTLFHQSKRDDTYKPAPADVNVRSGNVTGGNMTTCNGRTTTQMCHPGCLEGYRVDADKPGGNLTCSEVGKWYGTFPVCIKEEPFDLSLIHISEPTRPY
eukprot:TRINITY_DN8746_c0_g1_i2.p1 TRINITY_DN8746_c0_g1~~TRINITY_DN8746_c0_g1_i2.p1  ORF type:complete len:232 (+),score=45.82 TRINITY_DN8746_c0_g1_i2:511-1206(+)